MSKKHKKHKPAISDQTKECYIVRFDEQLPNGFWANNQFLEMDVFVSWDNRKNAHELVETMFLRQMAMAGRTVKIVSTTYV